MPSGIFMARPESLTAISAWLPGEWHITRSPFLKSRTSAPTSITSPENSLPIGLPAAAPWLVSPLAEPRSARLSAIALILISRSVALGLGSGTSWMTTPFGDATPAFMAITLLCRARGATRVSIERPVERALARLLRLHLVPPGADAGHAVVVAVHHLHRLAEAFFGIGEAQRARLVLVVLR